MAAFLDALTHAARPAASAAVILLGCALVGFAALPRRLRPAHSRLLVPLAISLGLTLSGWVSWLLGSLVGTAAVTPAFLIALVACTPWLPQLIRHCRRWARHLVRLAASSPLPAVLLGVLLLCTLPNLLIPLVDTDGMRYHLALPKLFLLEHRVFLYPYDVTGAYPQTAEMLAMVGLQLSAGEAWKFLHWACFVLSLAVLATAVHRNRATRWVAGLAPLLFAASPVAAAAAGYAFIDHLVVFHLSVAMLLASRRSQPLLVGLALAGALVTKYTAAPGVAAVALVVLLRGGRGRLLRRAAMLALPSLVALLPFAARNLVATGDPLFPIGHGLLGLEIRGALRETVSSRITGFHRATPGLLGITWDPRQGPVQADEVAGAHHLLGFPALAVALVEPAAWPFLAVGVAYSLLGLRYHPPTRLLLPMLWSLAGAEAMATGRFLRRKGRWLALLALGPAYAYTIQLVLTDFKPLDLLTGKVSREQYLREFVPGLEVARQVNRLPAGGVVMALDYHAPYYLDRPWIVEGNANEPPLRQWLAQAASSEDILRRLREHDVRYLIVPPRYGGGTFASLMPLAATPAQERLVVSLRQALRWIGSFDRFDLYEVPPATRPAGRSDAEQP